MNAFPHSKIKAQILEDENIGRISCKAVELISACSALFVRDLVVQDGGDSSGLHRKSAKSVPTTAQGENTAVPEKESCATNQQNFNRLPPPSSPIDLECIKHNIQGQPEYDFLHGVMDELTENNAPKYDAAARKRKRHQTKTMQQSTSTNSNDNTISHRDDVLTNLARDTAQVSSSMKNEDANDVCIQVVALQEAIDDTQDVTSHHVTKEIIIADDDDYD